MAKTHYLEKDRLAIAIAAIQILGVSDQPSASVDRWVAELESMEELTHEQLDLVRVKFTEHKKWATVFEQRRSGRSLAAPLPSCSAGCR